MPGEGEQQRLVSRQWSCSSLMSAVNMMDAPGFIEAIPDDPVMLGVFIADT